MLAPIPLLLTAFAVFFTFISASVLLVVERSVHNVVRFSANHQVENLAVRTNGQILLTIVGPSAAIYQIDPSSQNKSILIESFPYTSTLGITELSPDLFYFVLANVSLNPISDLKDVAGTAFIYKLDMNPFIVSPQGTVIRPPSIRKIAAIPNAKFLNGITSISPNDDFILAADSMAGQVWKINVHTGVVSVAIRDTTMMPIPDAEIPAGVNGIKVQNGWLYYTNTASSSLYRIPIHSDGSAAGTAQLIASSMPCDDFVLDQDGNAYVASGLWNAVVRVSNTGVVTTIAGTVGSASSSLVSPTAIEFGKTPADSSSIYVTTDGGVPYPVVGTQGLSRVDVGARA